MECRRKQDRRSERKEIRFLDRRRFDRRLGIDEFKRIFSRPVREHMPGKCRVVVTGIGVVAPANSIGKERLWNNLTSGISGFGPISIFNTDNYAVRTAGEIKDIDFPYYLGSKGLRLLDRSTKLINVAMKLAIEDCGIAISHENTYDIGVVVGTSMGSVRSISEFDISSLKNGFSGINPALFPNTVINSPAGQVAVKYDIRGLNTTVSSGFCSALDAVIYAYDSIRLNKVNMVFSGAFEELCQQTFLGFHKNGCLADSGDRADDLGDQHDFAKRNGVVLGEGAGVLVLEELEHARSRNADIYGEVLGFARVFEQPNGWKKVNGAVRAMSQALSDTELKPDQIDLLCACSDFSAKDIHGDRKKELHAINSVFKNIKRPPITAIKSQLGEGYGVSGIFQAITGLLAINAGMIPSAMTLCEDYAYNINILSEGNMKNEVCNIMINSFSPHGNNISLIIGKY